MCGSSAGRCALRLPMASQVYRSISIPRRGKFWSWNRPTHQASTLSSTTSKRGAAAIWTWTGDFGRDGGDTHAAPGQTGEPAGITRIARSVMRVPLQQVDAAPAPAMPAPSTTDDRRSSGCTKVARAEPPISARCHRFGRVSRSLPRLTTPSDSAGCRSGSSTRSPAAELHRATVHKRAQDSPTTGQTSRTWLT